MRILIKMFLSLILLLTSTAVFSQSPSIALVRSQKIQFYDIFLNGFRAGLKDNKADIKVDEYDLERPDTLAKVKNGNYSLFCGLGTETIKAFQQEIGNIPLVFSMILNPVASKIVNSLGASGTNITGVALDASAQTQLELLKKVMPSAVRVGVFYSNQSAYLINEAKANESSLNLKIVAVNVESSTKVPVSLKEIAGKVDILWLVPDLNICNKDSLSFILNFSLENKLPVMGFAPYLVKAGALFAYTYNYKNIGKHTAGLVARILAGEDPGTIPINASRTLSYVINSKTADYFGIKIAPSVLSEAEEVVK